MGNVLIVGIGTIMAIIGAGLIVLMNQIYIGTILAFIGIVLFIVASGQEYIK
jgi:hypothetical protein